MPEFPECLLIVTAEVDTAIEAEWNRWYDRFAPHGRSRTQVIVPVQA